MVCEECAVHIEGCVLWAYGYAGHTDETFELGAEAEGFVFSCAEDGAGWSMVVHCVGAVLSVDCYCCWTCLISISERVVRGSVVSKGVLGVSSSSTTSWWRASVSCSSCIDINVYTVLEVSNNK